jgi:hypothetical protein
MFRHSSTLLSYTEGVQELAGRQGAYWLIDLIASYQKRCAKDRQLRDFQIWQLRKHPDSSADLTCLRDTNDEAFRVRIPFTDFPDNELKLYVSDGILMLPDEY